MRLQWPDKVNKLYSLLNCCETRSRAKGIFPEARGIRAMAAALLLHSPLFQAECYFWICADPSEIVSADAH